MIELSYPQMYRIAPLFAGCKETFAWSCLQGHMGRAWANDASFPTAALIVNGDFFFLAGDASSPDAGKLACHIPGNFTSEAALFVPQNEAWAQVIEQVWGNKAQRDVRYAFKKEPNSFDRERLRSYCMALPPELTLRPIDRELYALAKQEKWSQDLVSQFPTAEDYAARGIGVAVLWGDKLAAGASSYIIYNGGIEIEIDTKKEFRRKGLALACGASLILCCLNRGLYPNWDAANKASASLSEKLGYRLDYEYPCYLVSR